jgi:uncharacterized phiE125 gp8 family phage protein
VVSGTSRIKLVSPPAAPTLTLAEAKAHLHVSHTDEDAIIAALTEAASRHCEQWTGRAFVDQTWDLYLDAFPTLGDMEIKIPLPPLIEIVQIAYDNSLGDEEFIPSGNYYVDAVSEFGWLFPQSNAEWPGTIDAVNTVRVRFRAGFMSTDSPAVIDVPEDIKAAVKLTLGDLFENRQRVLIDSTAVQLPWGAENLLRQYRVLLGMA